MTGSGKILIVDDEKIALKNLEHIIKKEGYDVVGTQSGQNALGMKGPHCGRSPCPSLARFPR